MKKTILSSINIEEMDLQTAQKIVNKKSRNSKEKRQLESAQNIIKIYEEIKPVIKIIDLIHMLGSYGSDLLEDLCVIKANNQIGLLKKQYMRESSESLSFRTDNSRQAKFLVRVIGQKKVVYNGYNLPKFDTQDLDRIPNMMLDIILGSFDIIKEDDIMVSPIAIYYE